MKFASIAKAESKAEMTLRIKRAATGEWEDGPKLHSSNAVFTGLTGFKLFILGRILRVLERLLIKLEELKR